MSNDESFMRQALDLARRAWGRTHPNPMVGAVIVEEGRVVAEGFHLQDGGPHAERAALNALGRRPAPGATLYVTLEPCSTHGRTGACCDAIRAAGIGRVVVGASDPNPAHAGHGFEVLRAAGIEVSTGVLAQACTDLNLLFNHWIVRRTPLFAGKVAVTLDGKVATRTGHSQWITNDAARADVHRWRRLFPAIAVGAGTVLADDPRLTARIVGNEEWCPVRFVFDGRLRTLAAATWPRVFTDAFRERTVIVTTAAALETSTAISSEWMKRLGDAGVQVWALDGGGGREGEGAEQCGGAGGSGAAVTFAAFRRRCAQAGLNGVYFEGGAHLLSGVLGQRELDYLFVYRAPVLLADEQARGAFGGLSPARIGDAVRLTDVRRDEFGDNDLVRGRVVYPEIS